MCYLLFIFLYKNNNLANSVEGEDSRRKRGREKPKARSISFISKPEDRSILLLFNKKVFFFHIQPCVKTGVKEREHNIRVYHIVLLTVLIHDQLHLSGTFSSSLSAYTFITCLYLMEYTVRIATSEMILWMPLWSIKPINHPLPLS